MKKKMTIWLLALLLLLSGCGTAEGTEPALPDSPDGIVSEEVVQQPQTDITDSEENGQDVDEETEQSSPKPSNSLPEQIPEPEAMTPPENSTFEVHFIDVGQGDCSLILCDGKAMLIDVGEASESSKVYSFRRHLIPIINGIEGINQNEAIRVYRASDTSDSVLRISIWNFQFNFRVGENTSFPQWIELGKKMEWDGIRKQYCASMIFNYSLGSKWISNLAQKNNELKALVEEELIEYDNGLYHFTDGNLIRTRTDFSNKVIMDKELKNYYRTKLFEYQDRPVIVSGKFSMIWDKHITFTTIRPYIPGCRTVTICNHINLYRPDVEKVFDITTFEKRKKYYIIGYCEPYGDDRMGIRLATDCGCVPIIRPSELGMIPLDVTCECYRFNTDEFIRDNQKYIIM